LVFCLSWPIVGKDGFDGGDGGDVVGDDKGLFVCIYRVDLCLCKHWWALWHADPSIDPTATLHY